MYFQNKSLKTRSERFKRRNRHLKKLGPFKLCTRFLDALTFLQNIHWVFSWICQRLLKRLIITSYFINYITMEFGNYIMNGLKVI